MKVHPSSPGVIAFFAHERGDARVRKRIAALQARGWEVLGFTFHRVRDGHDPEPHWENIHLGDTYNRRYFHRLWALVKSAGILWKLRRRLGGCAALYVVNTDNAALALLGRFFARRRVPLALELADVQPVMTGSGLVSKLLRVAERAVLRRSALLVTTSPGFVREYFLPVQHFAGRVFLLENKVYPSTALPASAPPPFAPGEGGAPWVIGCFGAFRCRRTLEIMRELAARLPGKVRFLLRGYASGTITDEFHNLIRGVPEIVFGGPYSYPDDLAALYGSIDMTWAFDYTDPSVNSAWLLPNRIYEGGCFGVPALAADNTETGRWIAERGLGFALPEPITESLAAFLTSLTTEQWTAVREHCAAQPREPFTGEKDYDELSAVLATLSAS